MARLTRKNIKVFAENSENNGVFGSLQANNPVLTNDVEQIQSLSAWGEGWGAATETSEELPPIEEMNSISYVTTYQQAYIMQEGLPEWATTVTYYKGSLVKEVTSTGFKIYCSLTDDNVGNLLSDTAHWKKVMDSDDLYAYDSDVVKLTGNQMVYGVKTFDVSPHTPDLPDSNYGVVNKNYVSSQINNLSNVCIKTSGNQTKSGTLTFNNSPIIPTVTTSDNSQKAASTAFVKNVLEAIFPVGAIYANTTNTNPNTFLGFGTWTLRASNIVTTVANSAPIVGTGIAIGITNGTSNGGMTEFRGNVSAITAHDSMYGKEVGTPIAGNPIASGAIGLTTDGNKSGMVADTSSLASKLTVYLWQRTV